MSSCPIRIWLKRLNFDFVARQKKGFTWTCSRSSGPGGQHVNKTDSKVTLRMDWQTVDWIPPSLLVHLNDYQYNPHIITCEKHRAREQNRKECLKKLLEWLQVKGECWALPNEPSKGQRERVEIL